MKHRRFPPSRLLVAGRGIDKPQRASAGSPKKRGARCRTWHKRAAVRSGARRETGLDLPSHDAGDRCSGSFLWGRAADEESRSLRFVGPARDKETWWPAESLAERADF